MSSVFQDPYGIHQVSSWRPGMAQQQHASHGGHYVDARHQQQLTHEHYEQRRFQQEQMRAQMQYQQAFPPPPVYQNMPVSDVEQYYTGGGMAQGGQMAQPMYLPHAEARANQEAFVRAEQTRLNEESALIMQLHQEISRSKSESERLQIMARTNEGNSRLISQEYRTLSRQKEALEDEYRRMWHLEERKIKAISDDTRRGFDQLRGNVISGLEKLDLTNRAMLESVETLISLGSDDVKPAVSRSYEVPHGLPTDMA